MLSYMATDVREREARSLKKSLHNGHRTTAVSLKLNDGSQGDDREMELAHSKINSN